MQSEELKQKIERLKEELREAEARERAEAKARRDAVPILMAYRLEPDSRPQLDEIYDPAVRRYYLSGHVVNREEAEAAGHDVSRKEGGMMYLFNTLSGRLVMRCGGGHVYVGTLYGEDPYLDETLEELNEFLRTHPEGGDVTGIVQLYREKTAAFALERAHR